MKPSVRLMATAVLCTLALTCLSGTVHAQFAGGGVWSKVATEQELFYEIDELSIHRTGDKVIAWTRTGSGDPRIYVQQVFDCAKKEKIEAYVFLKVFSDGSIVGSIAQDTAQVESGTVRRVLLDLACRKR